MVTAQEGPQSTIDGLNVQTHHESENVQKKTFSICLCSAFRNSCGYLSRYFYQCHQLDALLHEKGHRLRFVWGEGDSTDATLKTLQSATYRFRASIVDCTHGGADYPSIVLEERWKQLAHVGRCIFAAIPTDADAVVYVESDLAWEAQTLVTLIDRLTDYPAISPMIMLERKGWPSDSFYDTFVFRRAGRHFEHRPPYHWCYQPDVPFRVDSAGSCMAMRGEIARGLQFDEQTIFLDLCRQIYANGGSVWVDPECSVTHY